MRVYGQARPLRVYGQTAEEMTILQRARGSRVGTARPQPAAPAAAGPQMATPYPAAPPRTLQLLGTIDALLKAPSRPPRWALLKALAALEEHRATGVLSSHASSGGSVWGSRDEPSLHSSHLSEFDAAAAEVGRRLRAAG
jgi:hypothetical protein